MTSKRNLGPVLALTAAGIALAAMIAGFIAVGGPGDARDRRLDELTMGRVLDVLNIAQCAFDETGAAPATLDDARKITRKPPPPEDPQPCSLGTRPEDLPVVSGGTPTSQGDVSYEAVSTSAIRICANFRRPTDGESCNGICYREPPTTIYSQLGEPRPAGVHCYDIELVRGAATSALSHAGHMDVFE